MASDADSCVPQLVTDFVFDLNDSVTLSQITEEQTKLYNTTFRDLCSKVRRLEMQQDKPVLCGSDRIRSSCPVHRHIDTQTHTYIHVCLCMLCIPLLPHLTFLSLSFLIFLLTPLVGSAVLIRSHGLGDLDRLSMTHSTLLRPNGRLRNPSLRNVTETHCFLQFTER